MVCSVFILAASGSTCCPSVDTLLPNGALPVCLPDLRRWFAERRDSADPGLLGWNGRTVGLARGRHPNISDAPDHFAIKAKKRSFSGTSQVRRWVARNSRSGARPTDAHHQCGQPARQPRQSRHGPASCRTRRRRSLRRRGQLTSHRERWSWRYGTNLASPANVRYVNGSQKGETLRSRPGTWKSRFLAAQTTRPPKRQLYGHTS